MAHGNSGRQRVKFTLLSVRPIGRAFAVEPWSNEGTYVEGVMFVEG